VLLALVLEQVLEQVSRPAPLEQVLVLESEQVLEQVLLEQVLVQV
jgi:hypothetical protein